MPANPLFSARLEASLQFRATRAVVFPLLCPVQEALWLPGWSAEILHSESGVAELGCVFRTRDEDGRERIWTISRHDPEAGILQFVQFLADLCVIRLDIALEDLPGACLAHWVYSVRGFPNGDGTFFTSYAQAPFRARMARVEDHLNAYLTRSQAPC